MTDPDIIAVAGDIVTCMGSENHPMFRVKGELRRRGNFRASDFEGIGDMPDPVRHERIKDCLKCGAPCHTGGALKLHFEDGLR